jgi:hypothetical protein
MLPQFKQHKEDMCTVDARSEKFINDQIKNE